MEVWRVRRAPRVVLWGARGGDVAFGSREDRVREMEAVIVRELLREALGLGPRREWGGVSVVPFADMPPNTVAVVEAGSATPGIWIQDIDEDVQPLSTWSRRHHELFDPSWVIGPLGRPVPPEVADPPDVVFGRWDAAKLAAYTDGRGWFPGEDAG